MNPPEVTHKAGVAPYGFGIDRALLVRLLRDLAADIEAGKALPRSLSKTQTARTEDWMDSELTVAFVEPCHEAPQEEPRPL